MSDTNPTALSHTTQDRDVVFRIHGLDMYPEPALTELKQWVADGGVVFSAEFTKFLGTEAEMVARTRIHIEEQLRFKTLQEAYALVEQDLIQAGISSITHKMTPDRKHQSWGARVLSELKTVQLPDEVSLHDLINGPMAQAYRARGYNFEMTEAEREAQRRSFAYGNAALANPAVTRELVDRVAEAMRGPAVGAFNPRAADKLNLTLEAEKALAQGIQEQLDQEFGSKDQDD